MSVYAGDGGGGHIPQPLFDAVTDYLKENKGKARFHTLKNVVADAASKYEPSESESPIIALIYIMQPEIVVFSAYAQGMITAKLKDPHNLNSVKNRTKFTLVNN